MMKVVLALAAVAALAAAQPDGRPARIGLALSGGAALGTAHIGVLKVLEREGIDVVAISGNSMGSLVGGLYAAGLRAAEIESIAAGANWGHLFSAGVPLGARYLAERQHDSRYAFRLGHRRLVPSLPSGIVPLQQVEFLLMDLLAELEYNSGFDFDSLPIPYRAVAVDLVSGRLEVMRCGRLAQAIRASIAIPGVFAPELLDSMELVDGGVQQYLPVEPLLEFEPDLIIASKTMKRTPETGISLIDIVSRSMDLVGVEDLARQTGLADIVIEPDVDPFAHSDFPRAVELIAAGERAAEAALPHIRELLAGRQTARYRRAIAPRPMPVVRSVRLDGLRVTRRATLRPLVETRPGRYLLLRRLRDDLVRVYNTGLFDDVNYRLVLGPAESVDVVIEVQERAYGFYLFGLRYDNADRVGLGLEVGQGNLWGTGASAWGAVQLGDPTEFRAGLTGARLLTLPFGYRFEGSWSTIQRSCYETGVLQAEYGVEVDGAQVELGFGLGRNAYVTGGFGRRRARYRLPAVVPPALRDLPREDLLVGPSARFEFNNLDDLSLPRSGLAFAAEVRTSMSVHAPARDLIRAEVRWTRVSPLGRRLLFRENWSAGFSFGDSVRAEYFHAGGASLPGFAHEEFSSPYILSFEPALDIVIANLFGRADYPLCVRFFGAAAGFKRPDRLVEDATLLADLHWSAGAGFVGNTPLGPVTLLAGLTDFAKPRSYGYAPMTVRVWFEVGRDFRYSH
ncbi:MAG: patatin-like phospholipase family protein [bacterium]